MSKKSIITVYWAPAMFNADEDSWAMLYSSPTSVLKKTYKANKHGGGLPSCPAIKDTLINLFSLNSAIDERIEFPQGLLETMAYTDTRRERIPVDSRVAIAKERKSSIDNHINICYNMGWLLFASEPLEARITAPYYPSLSPVKGSMLTPGQFNIGKWFRPITADYHIPTDSTHFEIKAEEPLLFVEFMTDKRIQFKRFNVSAKLQHLAAEMAESPTRYGAKMSLWQRYQMAHNSQMPKLVLAEIQKNLID